MRICFILPEYITEKSFLGGIAQLFYRLAKCLVKNGHELHVIVHSRNSQDIIEEDVFVHKLSFRLPLLAKIINVLTLKKFSGSIYKLFFSFSAYRLLRHLDKQKKIDIVHSCNYHYTGLCTLLLTKIPHILQAVSVRSAWNKFMGIEITPDVRMREFLEDVYFRICHYVCVQSRCVRDMLIERLGLRNIKVIPHPFYVEVEQFDYSLYKSMLEGKCYLLFFGQNRLHKGIQILTHALPKVFERFPELRAVFVGGDTKTPLSSSIHSYIRKQNQLYHDRLIFIHPCPHKQLYPIIQHARIVVLPSLVDNLPYTCLEAMGLGRPVIGTVGCGFDEVIEDGKSGFLVPAGDVGALAKKICEVWSRPDLEKIGQAAKERTKEFAPEKTIRSLSNYYNEIVQKSSRKR